MSLPTPGSSHIQWKEPPNGGHIGISHLVFYNYMERLISECPLLEVSLYNVLKTDHLSWHKNI